MISHLFAMVGGITDRRMIPKAQGINFIKKDSQAFIQFLNGAVIPD